jgi:hypothetical protein
MQELKKVMPLEVVLRHENDQVTFGAMLTISEFQAELKNIVNILKDGRIVGFY